MFLHSSTFKRSHKKFKDGYEKSSMHSDSAVKETVNAIQKRQKRFSSLQLEQAKKNLKMNSQQSYAISNDTVPIVSHGTDKNLMEFEGVIEPCTW